MTLEELQQAEDDALVVYRDAAETYFLSLEGAHRDEIARNFEVWNECQAAYKSAIEQRVKAEVGELVEAGHAAIAEWFGRDDETHEIVGERLQRALAPFEQPQTHPADPILEG